MTETTTSAVRVHETPANEELSAAAVHNQRIQEFVDKINDVLLDNTVVLEEHEPTITTATQIAKQYA